MRTSSRRSTSSLSSRLQILPKAKGSRGDVPVQSCDTNVDDNKSTHVIAGILPVPPSITLALCGVLERAMLLRFEFAEDLDDWAHTPATRLAGATPFETLLDGDGLGVLRALIAIPINRHCVADAGRREEEEASEEDESSPLQLVS